jgi:Ca-activated chloride channel homolog
VLSQPHRPVWHLHYVQSPEPQASNHKSKDVFGNAEFRSTWAVLVLLFIFSLPALAQTQNSTQQEQAPTTQPSAEQSPAAQPSAEQAPATDVPRPPNSDNAQPTDAAPDQDAGVFVFKKSVEEVVLRASVVDDQRHLVTSLDQSAFTVFEDGVQQRITSFHRQDVPVAMGIVIDNSGSMRDKRDKVNEAVLNLLRQSNPQDEIFVVNFSQDSYLDQDFTSDLDLVREALQKVSMRGSTALYDAIVASSVHLINNTHLDNKVLLVITDGEDNSSRNTLQEARLQLQQKKGPTLYAIGLTGGDMGRQGHDALEGLADSMGGAAFFPGTLDELDSISRTIGRDIRSRYAIGYKSSNQRQNSEYRRVQVKAQARGFRQLTVRTRAGYYPGETLK